MRLPVCRGRSRASGDCEEAVFDGLLDGIVPEFEDDAPKWRLKADVPAIALSAHADPTHATSFRRDLVVVSNISSRFRRSSSQWVYCMVVAMLA